MAQQTKNPGNRFSDESLDPAAREADTIFNHPDMQALDDQGDAIIRDDEAKKKQEAAEQAEAKGVGSQSNQFNYSAGGKDTSSQSTGAKQSLMDRVGALFGTNKRKALIGGGATGIIATVLGLGALSPFGAFLQIKEVATDWAGKWDHSAHLLRFPQVKAQSYFTDPASCGKISVKCKLKSGVSDKEIDKLRESGVNIDDKDIATSSNGKKYLKGFSVDDGKGGKIRVSSAAEFTKLYTTQPRILGAFERTVSIRGISWRGSQALKKYREFSVNRKNPIGDETDKQKITEDMRRQVYGQGDPNGLDADKPSSQEDIDQIDQAGNGDNLAAVSGIDDEILKEAQEMEQDLVTKGPNPSKVLITSILNTLDPKKLTAVVKSSLSAGGKGALLGAVFGRIDSYCSVFQALRTISFGAKVLKAAKLIKYAGIFLTLADAAKAGHITAAQAAYIGTILVTPSRAEGSKGKTFADAEGFTLMTQGRISSSGGIARFSNGTPALQALDKVKSLMSLGGASASTCSKVKSWWGQAGLLLGGIATGILTAGASAIAGAGLKLAEGALLGVIGAYITPILISYAAGAVAPDPETDPEGGYGAMNAIAAGAGALGSQIGRGNGLRPITQDEFAAVNAEASFSDTQLARADQLNDGQSVLSVMQEKLAMSLLPVTSTLSSLNISGFMTNTMQLIGAAPSTAFGAFSPAYAATTDYYRGDQCHDDDYNAMNLATDAFCNPIYAQPSTDLTSPKFSPENVIDYMLNNGHIDDDGNPKSDEFNDFITNCVDGAVPLTSDGYDPELGNKSKYCPSKEEKYQFFRIYIMDQNIIDSYNAGIDNKLGVDEGPDQTAPPTDGAGGLVSSQGWVWPIQADLKPGPCWNVQVGSLGAHAGMDINTDNANNPVFAMHDGTITSAKFDKNGGNMIQMKTTDGLYVTMQHMKVMSVKAGDTVRAGQRLGIVGKTGRVFASSAGHFHFTVSHSAGVPSYGNLKDSFDPLDILPKPAPEGYTCTGR